MLVALQDATHANHGKAQVALATGPITVTLGTLAELTTVLRRVAKDRGLDGSRVARDGLRRLRTHAAYRDAPIVVEPRITAIYDADQRLSFVDAWNIAASREAREPLVTFDGDVQKAAKALQV